MYCIRELQMFILLLLGVRRSRAYYETTVVCLFLLVLKLTNNISVTMHLTGLRTAICSGLVWYGIVWYIRVERPTRHSIGNFGDGCSGLQ